MSDETRPEEPMSIKPDFSDVRNYDAVPPGSYLVEVVDIRGPMYPKKANEDGYYEDGHKANLQVALVTMILNQPDLGPKRHPQDRYMSIEGEYAGMYKRFVRCIKPDYDGEELDKGELIGRQLNVTVKDDYYEDNRRSVIDRMTGV